MLPQPDQFIWKQSAEGFFKKWQFPNCIGALDGKHIRIKAPPMSGSKYFCYKKFFSIVLMAICDYKYRFLWVDIGQFGMYLITICIYFLSLGKKTTLIYIDKQLCNIKYFLLFCRIY